MDDRSEDLEKQKRIKVEIEKAQHDTIAENKASLQYLDAESFSVQKGLSHNPEAYRIGSEKISNIALFLIILGVIADIFFLFIASHLKMGLVDMLPAKIDDAVYVIFILAPAIAAVFAIVEAIFYFKKTKQKLIGPIITSVITIVIFLVWQSIRLIIAGI